MQGLVKVREEEKYSDLVIECEGREWRVHRAIVCSASAVHARECDGYMKERFTGRIMHDEFDAETMGRMLAYIYKRTYNVASEVQDAAKDDGATPATSDTSKVNECLIAHANVYGIGDYYEISTLKTLAADRFREAAESGRSVDGFIDVVRTVCERTTAKDEVSCNACDKGLWKRIC